MRFPARIVFPIALALLAGAPLPAAETFEIQPHWLAGKKYSETIQTDEHSVSGSGPEKMEERTTMTIELTMTVSPRRTGQPKRMTMRYERMAMEVDMNGQKMGYDSANPAAGTDPLEVGKTISATVGQELQVVLDDHDHIVGIENYDDFIKHLAPAATPDFDPAKMFSRQSLIQMLEQGSLQAVPGKPVAVGETWPFGHLLDLPELGKVAVAGSYTLQSVGDHGGALCAEILTDGTLALDMSASSAGGASEGDATAMKILDGSIKGPIWFDLKLGIARETELVEEMTIAMKDPTDASVTINVPTTATTKVTLTKIEDVK